MYGFFGTPPVKSFFFPIVPVIRITLEEIVVQQVADFEEQVGVDPTAVEDLVGVLAREAELAGEPGDGAPLPVEFLLDEIADVRFFVHCVCLWWSLAQWANKMGGNYCCLPVLKASANALAKNKQNSPRPNDVSLSQTYSSFAKFCRFFKTKNKSVKARYYMFIFLFLSILFVPQK